LFASPSPTKRRKQQVDWSHAEETALVQYVALHQDLCDARAWPAFGPKSKYWQDAADYVHDTTGCDKRQGSRFTIYMFTAYILYNLLFFSI